MIVAEQLIEAARRRPPNFVIGGQEDPYLLRWYLQPRREDVGNLYLHCILRDDDDRAHHDHPWDFESLILRGAYRDVTPSSALIYRAGESVRHAAADAHRLEVVDGPVWSLVTTGPKVREWGFHCPRGWVPWQQFVAGDDRGNIGVGCGA